MALLVGVVLGAPLPAAEPTAPAAAAVAATVNGDPVTVAEVRYRLLPPEPWVGPGAPTDPRRQALDQAIGVRLLAQEALRRGLEAAGNGPEQVEARRIQALIEQELAGAADIGEEQAQAFYRRHARRMNRIRSQTVAAIAVAERRQAEELVREAAGAGPEVFAGWVAEHSVDPASKARGGEISLVDGEDQGLGDEVHRLAFALLEPGSVGLAKGANGLFYVLRATAVDIDIEPWNPTLAVRVRNLMAHQRRQAVVRSLVGRLRAQADVRVYEHALDDL